MKYAVIIVTYNRLTLLKECLAAIEGQRYPFDEIILVDNGSTDGTREYLTKYDKKESITILRHEQNRGGAYGFHVGIKEAEGHNVDWLLLIDDDAILDKDFLKITNDFILDDKDPSLAYSCSVYTFNKIYPRHRTRRCTHYYFAKPVAEKEYTLSYFDCDGATFCGLMIRRTIIRKIGYPKSEYFIWNDDAEYCRRISNISPIRNINRAVLNHKTNGTFNDLNWKMYYGARNEIDMVKSHYGYGNLVLCIVRIVVRAIRYFIVAPKYGYTHKDVFYMYKQAIHDGLHGILGVNEKYYPKS